MSKQMLINAVIPEDIRVAVVSTGRLEKLFEETLDRFRTRGNIYLGKVSSVQPALEACFVDYGEQRQGFLPMDEILSIYWHPNLKDRSPRIEQAIKPQQTFLVQVAKEPIGNKGARLTTDVSLAGRYLVLMPFNDKRGVSRKIEDPEKRKRFLEIGTSLKPPKGMGFILRTAVLDQAKRTLGRDMNYLIRLWKEIYARAKKTSYPGLLHTEADIVQRVLRDYYTSDIQQVWIDDASALERARSFFKLFLPRQIRKLKMYTGKVPIFSSFGVEEQIEDIHARKVELPSGGSLVIEQTEALVSIDVNSGKAKGARMQEELSFETNLEAAKEIARQLRLRNLGGIVVIDFIDMQESKHKISVERSLRNAMRSDKARHQIGKISSFGLCTLTRQRLDQSIRLVGYRECPTCRGDGLIRSPDTATVHLIRSIQAKAADGSIETVRVRIHPELANHMQNKHRSDILALEREFSLVLDIQAVPGLDCCEEQVEFLPRVTQRPQVTDQHPVEGTSGGQSTSTDPPAQQAPRHHRSHSPSKSGKRKRWYRNQKNPREEV